MMKSAAFVIFFMIIFFGNILTEETAEYFPRQRVEPDPDLERYLREAIENFREQMKEGIPAIKMPVLDPLELKNLDINVDENLANLNLKIRKLKVRCLSIFNITCLAPNLEEMFLAINLTLPEIYLSGEYTVDGKLAKIFPIYGTGHFDINATAIHLFGKGKLAFTTDTMKMKFLKFDFTWEELAIFMENFLGGGSFSEVLQKIIPSLGRDIFHVYKPLIMEKLEEAVTKKVNEKLNSDLLKDIIKGIIPKQ